MEKHMLSLDILEAFTTTLVEWNDNRYEKYQNILDFNKFRPAYDPTASYSLGDFIYYNKGTYVCVSSSSVTGAFDSTKWQFIGYNDFMSLLYNAAVRVYTPGCIPLHGEYKDAVSMLETRDSLDMKMGAISTALRLAKDRLDMGLYGAQKYNPLIRYEIGDTVLSPDGCFSLVTETIQLSDPEWSSKIFELKYAELMQGVPSLTAFLLSMVDVLEDSDNSITIDHVYRYGTDLYRAVRTYTKSSSQSWRDLSLLEKVKLKDVLWDGILGLLISIDLKDYMKLSSTQQNSEDYRVFDDLYDIKVGIATGATIHSMPGDNTICVVDDIYSGIYTDGNSEEHVVYDENNVLLSTNLDANISAYIDPSDITRLTSRLAQLRTRIERLGG